MAGCFIFEYSLRVARGLMHSPCSSRLLPFAHGQDGLATLQFTEGLDVSGNTLYVVASESSALNVFDLRGTLGLMVNGAVGIGTAAPRSALDVAGTIRGTDLAVDQSITAMHITARNVASELITASSNIIVERRLAIGTNSPLVPLHVVSPGNLNTFLDGGSSIGTWLTLGNRAGGIQWNFISTGTNNGEGPGKLLISAGPSLGTVNSIGNFVLEPDGKVGLGTFTPGQLLQVGDRNKPNSQGMIRLASRGGIGVAARQWDIGVPESDEAVLGTGYSFVIDDADAEDGVPELIVRWDNHNVGIGTATPQAPLEVVGNTAFPHLRVSAASNAPFGSFLSLNATATAGGKDYFIFSSGASAGEGRGKLVFQNHTDGRNIMAFETNGFVGIGTLSPGSSLQVNGAVRARGGGPGPFGNANNGYTFGAPGDNDSGMSSSGDGQVEFYSNSTEVMRIAGSHNVGIGTNAPQQRLHVIGNILASGTITPNSDRNAKTDVAPVDVTEILEKVTALPISSWRFKTEAEEVRHVGPMAQDFQSAFALGEQKTAIATVDADGVALAAIQGLNRKLEEREASLRKELERKDAENADLKARLERLERLLGQSTGSR